MGVRVDFGEKCGVFDLKSVKLAFTTKIGLWTHGKASRRPKMTKNHRDEKIPGGPKNRHYRYL